MYIGQTLSPEETRALLGPDDSTPVSTSTNPGPLKVGQRLSAEQVDALSNAPETLPSQKAAPVSTKDKLLGAGKAVGDFFTGSEQGLGADIATAITAPGQIKQAQKASEDDTKYLQTLIDLKHKAQVAGQDTSHWDNLINNYKPQGYQGPQIPSTGKVLGDVAGTTADLLSAGTYGAAKTGAMKTGELAAKALPTAVDVTLSAAGKMAEASAQKTAVKTTAAIADTIAPKLSAAETASALASRGGTKSGVLGKISLNPDPTINRIAATVKELVPEFSTKKSLVENINATKDAVSNIASDLKKKVIASGQDRIYSFKELGSALKGVERPTLIAADSTLNRAYDLVTQKAMEIARDNGGKVSDLFQARKEFDEFVEHQFPNLYSSETLTPMRNAIKGIRNAMTDFTAEHLPEDIKLRDSLTSQSRLITAIENMSEKAASGEVKEVGTNALERTGAFLKKHPVVAGLGGAAAYSKAKDLPIVGNLIP